MVKKFVIILVLILLPVGGYFAYRSFMDSRAAQSANVEVETVTIEYGRLVSTISASGEVRSSQTAELYWQTSGTVETVDFKVGDHVQTGDVLAQLAQSSLSQSAIQAQVDIANAQKTLDDLYANAELAKVQAMQSIASHAKAVRDAQYQLDNYTVPADQAELDAIEALELTETQLDQARAAFEPYKFYPSSDLKRQELKDALDAAQSDYNAAVKRLDYEYELQVAKANLEKAKLDYKKWENGPDSNEVAAAEGRLAAADAILRQAWIEAPFDATVTGVSVQPGDLVNPNSLAFRLDDLSTLYVDLQVSEVDIDQISLGQTGTLSFDAIRGKEYQGEVVEIASVGIKNQGVVNFIVTVELSDPDERVRAGMTAWAEIVVSQSEQALLIPNQAVRVEEGVQLVYVLRGPGQIESVEVVLGESSDTHSEVLSGELNAGDRIVLNPPSTTSDTGPQFFGGPMGGGGGGPGEEGHPPIQRGSP